MTQQNACFVKLEGKILGPMSLDEVYDAWIHHDFRDTDQFIHRSSVRSWTPLKTLFRKAGSPPMPTLAEQVAIPVIWQDHLLALEEKRAKERAAEASSHLGNLEDNGIQESIAPNADWPNDQAPEITESKNEKSVAGLEEPSEKARLLMASLEVPDFEELSEWLESLNTKGKIAKESPLSATKATRISLTSLEPAPAVKPHAVPDNKLLLDSNTPVQLVLPKPYQPHYSLRPRSGLKKLLLAVVALVAFSSFLGILYLQMAQKNNNAGSPSAVPTQEQENAKAEPSQPLRSPTKPRRE